MKYINFMLFPKHIKLSVFTILYKVKIIERKKKKNIYFVLNFSKMNSTNGFGMKSFAQLCKKYFHLKKTMSNFEY